MTNGWSAYFVTNQKQAPTSVGLSRFLKEKLPEYMVPSVFVKLEALPLTPNGKVDRRALPRPEAVRPELEAPCIMPKTDAEHAVAAAWRAVLQLERVGTHDNFFELGGHSLRLAQVHRKLQEVFGPALSMVEMFQYPTIHSLAEFLSNETEPNLCFRAVSDSSRGSQRPNTISGINRGA